MVDRIKELRKYIHIGLMEGDLVDENAIYSKYQYVKSLFEDDSILKRIDEFHAAYNTLITARSLMGKERLNLLSKMEDFEE